ncbi:MAG: MarR family transcriptional regulator [Sporolactobacillus sp.]
MNDELFKALYEIMIFFNQPQHDQQLLMAAGVKVNPSLFPLLVHIGMQPSSAIGTLAALIGRSYSAVSRQADQLESAGLVRSKAASRDNRSRVLRLTETGKTLLNRIDDARRQEMEKRLADWTTDDLAQLLKSMHHLADTLKKPNHSKVGK